MHRIPGTNLIFVHIPKTAGRAIRTAFKTKSKSSAHTISSAWDDRFMEKPFIRFCVVREPISRFVSAYLYNVSHAESKATGIRQKLVEIDALSDINILVNAARESRLNFEQFMHFRTQTSYIRATRPQIILRQENIASDIKIIAQLAKFPNIKLPIVNSSADRAEELAGVITELSQENLAFLRSFYAVDFELLGYLPSDNPPMPDDDDATDLALVDNTAASITDANITEQNVNIVSQ